MRIHNRVSSFLSPVMEPTQKEYHEERTRQLEKNIGLYVKQAMELELNRLGYEIGALCEMAGFSPTEISLIRPEDWLTIELEGEWEE